MRDRGAELKGVQKLTLNNHNEIRKKVRALFAELPLCVTGASNLGGAKCILYNYKEILEEVRGAFLRLTPIRGKGAEFRGRTFDPL